MVASKHTSVNAKSSSDRHRKVNGRDRRVRIPLECAHQVFDLMQILGHRTAGQTIEWLLSKAEPAVSIVLNGKAPLLVRDSSITSAPSINNQLQVPSKLSLKMEKTNIIPVHDKPVVSGPGYFYGVEPEYTSFEMDLALFQAANPYV